VWGDKEVSEEKTDAGVYSFHSSGGTWISLAASSKTPKKVLSSCPL
jgi:hypothetical protein